MTQAPEKPESPTRKVEAPDPSLSPAEPCPPGSSILLPACNGGLQVTYLSTPLWALKAANVHRYDHLLDIYTGHDVWNTLNLRNLYFSFDNTQQIETFEVKFKRLYLVHDKKKKKNIQLHQIMAMQCDKQLWMEIKLDENSAKINRT